MLARNGNAAGMCSWGLRLNQNGLDRYFCLEGVTIPKGVRRYAHNSGMKSGQAGFDLSTKQRIGGPCSVLPVDTNLKHRKLDI